MTEHKGYALQTKMLSVGYGKESVVEEVSFSLKPGQVTIMVGPNGCGKSTLLKTFTRQLKPQAGTILILDKDFTEMGERDLARHIAMVMTTPLQPAFMTCKEVVETGRYPYTGFLGILSETDHQKVEKCMRETNVWELADRPFSAVSDGQRQRVMLARGLCQEPEILILDEPTTFLDMKYKLEFFDLVMRLSKEQGIAVLMSLHEISYAKLIGDFCICVRNHRIERMGVPKEILTDEYLCRLFDVDQALYRRYQPDNVQQSFVYQGAKKLRKGYTTGSCAAAGAYASARLLLGGGKSESVQLTSPTGVLIEIPIETSMIRTAGESAVSTVRKDAGDDPDVTNGIEVITTVVLRAGNEICIEGGVGIGRVTKPGLNQPVGEAAINSGPRQMIIEALEQLSEEFDYTEGFDVLIEAPAGVEIAEKTFNPKLGIVGGISILGSTGIVEPMSEKALIDTIRTEISVKAAQEDFEKRILVAPGNYGREFLRESYHVELEQAVKCSNYIGETIDLCESYGVEHMLLVGHIGKLAKLACGIMNTHSKQADGRIEAFITCGVSARIPSEVLLLLMEATTTDSALEILQEANCLSQVMKEMTDRILFYLNRRAYKGLQIEVMMFSNVYGLLGKSEGALKLLSQFQAKDETIFKDNENEQ